MARGLQNVQAGRGVYHKTICSLTNVNDQSVKPVPELIRLDPDEERPFQGTAAGPRSREKFGSRSGFSAPAGLYSAATVRTTLI